jgi:LacI family transcriptional regulator
MSSLKELALMVGVSPTTVSFVLNGREKEMRISQEVTDKILEAARKVSYQPNNIAVALRTGQSKIIGLIVEDIGNNFFSTLAKTIEDELSTYDYRVVYCSTENQSGKGNELINMLQRQQVDGYLITPSSGMGLRIAELLKKKIPVVQIDRYSEKLDCPYVMVDNYGGIEQGVTHLINKGKKKIGFVTVDLDLVQMKEREKGFTETLKKHRLSLKKGQLLKLDYTLEKAAAVNAIGQYLQGYQPDAVIFSTNYVGISGLQAIKDLHIRIPEELAVICFDDNELFSLCTPTITAIQQPIQSIARSAVKILMGELGVTRRSAQKKVRIPTKIIYRQSV